MCNKWIPRVHLKGKWPPLEEKNEYTFLSAHSESLCSSGFMNEISSRWHVRIFFFIKLADKPLGQNYMCSKRKNEHVCRQRVALLFINSIMTIFREFKLFHKRDDGRSRESVNVIKFSLYQNASYNMGYKFFYQINSRACFPCARNNFSPK